MRYAVCIDHLDEQQLNFFGWSLVRKDSDFSVYRHLYSGEEQIVDMKGKQMLFVDDYNDAQQMGNFIVRFSG